MSKKSKFKLFESIEKDDCFRMAIANILQIDPKKIPNFSIEHGNQFMHYAREWLNKMGKTITFCDIKSFLQCWDVKYNNGFIFPQGMCIVAFNGHVELMHDGQIISSNGNNNNDSILGYFIIHDLCIFNNKKLSKN